MDNPEFVKTEELQVTLEMNNMLLEKIVQLGKEVEDLKLSLNSAKIVMQYYDKNKGIHPMLNDFATEWLEINNAT